MLQPHDKGWMLGRGGGKGTESDKEEKREKRLKREQTAIPRWVNEITANSEVKSVAGRRASLS